jgi:hypothetical protein
LVNLLKIVLATLVLQVIVVQAFADSCRNGCQAPFYSENPSAGFQNKIKRSRLLKLYSQSSLPEEKEALKLELNSIQILIANQLNSKLPQKPESAVSGGEADVTEASLPFAVETPTMVGSQSVTVELPTIEGSLPVATETLTTAGSLTGIIGTPATEASQAEVNEAPVVMDSQAKASETEGAISEVKSSPSTSTQLDKSQLDYCDLEEVNKSIGSFEQLYLAQAPVNKFWEGEELLQRELVNINIWLGKINEINKIKSENMNSAEAAELIKLLNEGNGITVFESLRRLEQFLETERMNLILNYSEMQDFVADTLLQLHAINENLDRVNKGEESPEAALLDIVTAINSKNGFDNYQERIDFIMQVILLDIVFRDSNVSSQDKNKQDINLLVAIENIKYQMAKRNLKTVDDLKKILAEAQEISTLSNNKISCLPKPILVQKNDFYTGKSLDLGSSFFSTMIISKPPGKVVSTPVLKPWTTYIDPDCLSLNKWQTTHSFWCTSDSQTGCDRITVGTCRK